MVVGNSHPDAELRWEPSADGFAFWSLPAFEPQEWPGLSLTLAQGEVARVGQLVQLLDENAAVWNGGRVVVPHAVIAGMSSRQLLNLGLPFACPHTLVVESGRHSITEPQFRFEARFRDPQARRVEPPSRVGCLATFGTTATILHEPQYSVVEAIDIFNATAPSVGAASASPDQVNVRLSQIARLHTLLGVDENLSAGGVQADQYLRDFRVVVPSQFTLRLSRSEDGVLIDPELLVSASSEVPGASPKELAVPAARQRDFAERFRRMDGVRGTYSLGGDWFVALPQSVQAALRVVKEVQRSDASTRASFATQPRRFLKARLEGQIADDELESIFFDDDYGDRVSGVGLWQPKVLPWLQRQSQSWLPIEHCGITVGDTQIALPPAEIDDIRQAVEEAMSAGQSELSIKGYAVPATNETLDALRALSNEVAPAPSPTDPVDDPVAEPRQKVVLLIKDNLEDPSFGSQRVARKGARGTPKTLVSTLMSHQMEALQWLQDHWLGGTTGALLADDMGLGKTFETLAFICWLREQMADGLWARTPVLIVAPSGLLDNWRAEMAKHVSAAALGNIVMCWGGRLSQLRRAAGRDTTHGIPVLDTEELAAADVVLTTYETLRDYQHSFCLVNWSLAVFDEAQKIKNPQTLATSAAKAVANKASLAVALTGTPVENRMSDLWCIVDAVQPLRLGSLRRFIQDYEGDDEATVIARRSLRSTLCSGTTEAPMLMLRRLKNDHLPGLPKVRVHRYEETMPAVQAEAYTAAVNRAKAGGADKGTMLKALHEMRMVSLHPDIANVQSADDFVLSSARLAKMMSVLDDVHANDEKALVFVEFRDVQAVLIELLQQRYRMPSAPFVINGDVPGDRRKRRVDEFQDRPGFDVMLLSPRAGGVGLTLTAANHVVHLARWWNPAVEDQCTDRVNRIGQKRDVHVYLPLAKHPVFGEQSFDLLLDGLLMRKRAQSEDALSPGDMSSDDVTALFSSAMASPNS